MHSTDYSDHRYDQMIRSQTVTGLHISLLRLFFFFLSASPSLRSFPLLFLSHFRVPFLPRISLSTVSKILEKRCQRGLGLGRE